MSRAPQELRGFFGRQVRIPMLAKHQFPADAAGGTRHDRRTLLFANVAVLLQRAAARPKCPCR